MWRIVYLNDRYGIMNLLTEESCGWYEFKSDAVEAFDYLKRTEQL